MKLGLAELCACVCVCVLCVCVLQGQASPDLVTNFFLLSYHGGSPFFTSECILPFFPLIAFGETWKHSFAIGKAVV